MQAFTKYLEGGNVLLGVLREDRSTGEAEYLEVPEEVHDIAVTFSEVAPVAFVENHHELFVPQILNPLVVEVFLDGGIQLLDGCEDDFLIGVEAFDKFVGVISPVHCTRFESLVFALGLGVQVVTVHYEEDLVDAVQLGNQLGSLEGCERLARTGGVPDVAVLVCVLDTVQDLFYCIILVRTKHHQALVPFMKDNVLAEHLAQGAFVEEVRSELAQVIDRFVVDERPVEGELVTAVGIIGEIACVDAIGDDKELDVVEQATERGFLIALHLVVGLLKFNTTLLELYLHQRKAVHEDRDIVTAGFSTFNGNLVGYLELVLAPVILV